MSSFRLPLLCLAGAALAASAASAADWPQWLGPARNGTSPETGLLTDWSTRKPKVLWKVPGGDGYSTVAVVGDRAYTLVQRDDRELAIALDAATGKELWATPLGSAFKNQFGNGPRSTPAIAGGRVYVQSVNGPLVCLNAADGKIVWQQDLLKRFGVKNITWGLSASPLLEGDLVLAIPGAKGAGVAAFHKLTGELAWKTSDDKAAYASPVAVTIDGKHQLVFFNAAGLLGVSADKGTAIWRMPWTTEFDCNIATPLVIGSRLFVSSGEDVGCALLQLRSDSGPDIVWESKGKKSVMINYWATSVVHDGYLYGMAGEFNKRIDLRCVEAATGKLKWSKEDFGKAAVTLAEGHLFLTTKTGDLVVVAASPASYQEKGRLSILGETRTAPTVANRKLYLRDRENIFCLDIAAAP
jgi:outer membrane protein assembly factor BamB